MVSTVVGMLAILPDEKGDHIVKNVLVGLLALLYMVLPTQVAAQTEKSTEQSADIGAFLSETMRLVRTGNCDQVAWWYPYEYYVESQIDDTTSRAEAREECAYLKPYITVLVLASIDAQDGTSVYASEKSVRARAALVAPDGNKILPLVDAPSTIEATVSAIRDALAAQGGVMTKLQILVFPNKGRDGKPIVDASTKGKLKLVLKADAKYPEAVFVWNTPFDALVSAPPCAKCREKLSAKWTFCPWCGEKLPEAGK